MNKAKLIQFLESVRSSYWFIPTIMVIGSIMLSVLTVWFDGRISADWPEKIPFLFSNKPDGARALLSSVSGSMITVAGVTFSLTLLAVSHATGQFGPRLLNNFMRDRGNQFTLGTFVSTFIYCLLVLRTVRSAEEPPHNQEVVQELAAAFVPHISITVALVLTLCSVGVLIYFIHHVPESIRLSNVVSGVGRQLIRSVEELFPEMIAHDRPDDEADPRQELPDNFMAEAEEVLLDETGYVQSVDEGGVMAIAEEHDLLIYLRRKPGDFCCSGKSLALAWPATNVNEQVAEEIRLCYALGVHRTINQNTMFAVDQLVEVAQRALSPGVNDPMTAMYCLDWLQAALVKLTHRKPPEVFRYNEDGKLRLFSRPIRFEDFCSRVFDQLRQYVAEDRNASIHMLKVINEIRMASEDENHRQILDQHAKRLIAQADLASMAKVDIETLKQADAEGCEFADSGHRELDDIFGNDEDKTSG